MHKQLLTKKKIVVFSSLQFSSKLNFVIGFKENAKDKLKWGSFEQRRFLESLQSFELNLLDALISFRETDCGET